MIHTPRPKIAHSLCLIMVFCSISASALPDLIATPSNNVGGAGVINETFVWSITISNIGDATATIGGFVPFFADNLPDSNITYGAVSTSVAGGASGSLDCSIDGSSNMLCLTSGTVSIPAGGTLTLNFNATPTAALTFSNPRAAGSCPVDLTNAVTEDNEANNICAPTDNVVVGTGASGPDLTTTKGNSVGGTTEMAAGSFTWSVGLTNGGDTAATFSTGQTILLDEMPNTNITYGTPSVTGQSGITGTGSLSCSVASSNLTCVASGGSVIVGAGGGFTTNVVATPVAAATFNNPRTSGTCAADPNSVVNEGDESNNVCSDTVIVNNSPDLRPTKTNNTAGQGTVDTPFTWTITINNIGLGTFNLESGFPLFVDQLPDTNMTYGAPATSSSGLTGTLACSISTSTLACTASSTVALAAGGHVTVSVVATPTAPGSFVNPRAGGSCAVDPTARDLELDENNNTCSNTVEVDTGAIGADLTVVKNNDLNGDTTELAAGPFLWSLQVTNGGDADATFANGQTILTDNLPNSNMSYEAPTVTGQSGMSGAASCSVVGSDLTCVSSGGVTISAGGGFTANVMANPQASNSFVNPRAGGICAVDPGSVVTEGDEGNNSCANTVTVNDSPDLTVTKTNNTSNKGAIGTPFTWMLVVNNIGGAPFNLQNGFPFLIDSLPDSNMTYGTPATSSSGLTGTIVCTVAEPTPNLLCLATTSVALAAGGSFTVTLTATPTATGTFDNPRAGGECIVDSASNDLELNESNNTCSDSVVVPAGPDLTVTKTNDTSGLTEVAAEPYTWSLKVNNDGDEPATFANTQIVLRDQLPNTNMNYQAPTISNEGGISGTGSVSCGITNFDLTCSAVGGTVVLAEETGSFTVDVNATPSASGTFDNPREGGLCAVDPDDAISEDNDGNNTCANSVGVDDSPDVIATKTNDTFGLVTVGQTFTWSIRIENTGIAEWIIPVTELVLLDNLPDSNVTYGTPTVTASSGLAGTVTCTIDESSDLACVADTPVGVGAAGHLTISFTATPTAEGQLDNPRAAGTCAADPSDVELETDENNNDCADSVTSSLFADGFESGTTSAWTRQVN